MPAFLPSAQFIRISGALLIVAGGIYGAYYIATAKPEPKISTDGEKTAPVLIADNPLLQQVADLDSDKDGLRDWEEKLWKTSAMNKDSDGDGTTDGVEVSTNRNPLVKGPKDTIRETIDLRESLSEESLKELSATDRLAREFFVEYLSYKEGGKALSPSEEKKLLLSTLKKSSEVVAQTKIYTEKDIVLTQSNDSLAYKSYGNAIGLAITTNSFKSENELILLERAFRTQNINDLAAIEKISLAYRAMLTNLLILPTPKDLVVDHVALITDLNTIGSALHDMTLITTDPVQSIVSIANYESYVKNMLVSIQNIQGILKLHSVAYEPAEPGNVIMQIGIQPTSP